MRLLIVSNTPHHLDIDGRVVGGWGPTVRELEHLAALFHEVVLVAPLYGGPPPPTACRYESGRVRLRPVRAAGGAGIVAKAGILARVPSWVAAIRSELRHADAVHVRCPANISLIALLVLGAARRRVPRWVKYAGNWSPTSGEATSYRFQRWLLRSRWCRAEVTVNGAWPSQLSHVHPFVNPTLTDGELRAAARAAAGKTLGREVRIVFAGRLEEPKGAGRALDIADRLVASDVRFHLDLAGDGPDRRRYESLVSARRLAEHVTFHGWLDRAALDHLYAAAHVVLLPSLASEGFPKVLAEGMAYGVVPVAGDVSCIAEELAAARSGAVVPATDVDAFVLAVTELTRPGRWDAESEAAVEAAARYTYDRYLSAVRDLFRTSWGVELPEEESSSLGSE